MSKREQVECVVKAVSLGNPGPSGWGAVFSKGKCSSEMSGVAGHSSNNRAELLAVCRSIKTITARSRVSVFTDSGYVVDGVTQHLEAWKRNGWRTLKNKPLAHSDLWQELVRLTRRHEVEFFLIKHHGCPLDAGRAYKLAARRARKIASSKNAKKRS